MALFYFHLSDGSDLLLDPEGRQLPANLVGPAAIAEARAIVAADARTGHINLAQRIVVHDASGEVVFGVDFEDAVQVTHDPQHAR
jgi:hypothetical protein